MFGGIKSIEKAVESEAKAVEKQAEAVASDSIEIDMGDLAETVSTAVDSAEDKAEELVAEAKDKAEDLKENVEDKVEAVKDKVEDIKDKVEDVVDKVKDTVGEGLEKLNALKDLNPIDLLKKIIDPKFFLSAGGCAVLLLVLIIGVLGFIVAGETIDEPINFIVAGVAVLLIAGIIVFSLVGTKKIQKAFKDTSILDLV
eukprot:TRINITY_DN1644_c0_g1_i4.p1 TRINITY_DN1644_c0_g1~~TRINITY_DN1644_c0_g1_i4.p1  ORF type:complete len:199 (+),score=102.83 TRINITY_DN1644_c0_g1_i4:47-643(+)